MSDRREERVGTGWAFVWDAKTKNFTMKNPQGMVGLPNVYGLGELTVKNRESLPDAILMYAQQADCMPLVGKNDKEAVYVFLCEPYPKGEDEKRMGANLRKKLAA